MPQVSYGERLMLCPGTSGGAGTRRALAAAAGSTRATVCPSPVPDAAENDGRVTRHPRTAPDVRRTGFRQAFRRSRTLPGLRSLAQGVGFSAALTFSRTVFNPAEFDKGRFMSYTSGPTLVGRKPLRGVRLLRSGWARYQRKRWAAIKVHVVCSEGGNAAAPSNPVTPVLACAHATSACRTGISARWAVCACRANRRKATEKGIKGRISTKP